MENMVLVRIRNIQKISHPSGNRREERKIESENDLSCSVSTGAT